MPFTTSLLGPYRVHADVIPPSPSRGYGVSRSAWTYFTLAAANNERQALQMFGTHSRHTERVAIPKGHPKPIAALTLAT